VAILFLLQFIPLFHDPSAWTDDLVTSPDRVSSLTTSTRTKPPGYCSLISLVRTQRRCFLLPNFSLRLTWCHPFVDVGPPLPKHLQAITSNTKKLFGAPFFSMSYSASLLSSPPPTRSFSCRVLTFFQDFFRFFNDRLQRVDSAPVYGVLKTGIYLFFPTVVVVISYAFVQPYCDPGVVFRSSPQEEPVPLF